MWGSSTKCEVSAIRSCVVSFSLLFCSFLASAADYNASGLFAASSNAQPTAGSLQVKKESCLIFKSTSTLLQSCPQAYDNPPLPYTWEGRLVKPQQACTESKLGTYNTKRQATTTTTDIHDLTSAKP